MTARRGSAEGLTSEEKWEAYIQERYGLTVSEYGEWLEDLRREKSEHLTSPKVEWPDEPDLPMAPTPDPLPVDLFPKVLRDQIKSVAGALQVPSDLPSILSIASCSPGLGGKIVATIDAKWRKVWCVFYGVAVLRSGERKSGAFDEMFRPIYEWLKDEQKSIEPAYRTAMDKVDVREQELAQAKRRRPTDFTDINDRRTDLETAKATVPYKPTWACDDVTSEALVEAMAMNDGRAALLSPEGGPLRNLDGRYSDGVANTEVFKKGHDDRIAEHVPGCNMAFRRDALLTVDGFNPAYLRAGDDVDICWRLQAKKLNIGFVPSALVWHHHRSSVRAFWRQQVGYGEGESWLDAHHPEKFLGGQMVWGGRIYSPLPFLSTSAERLIRGSTLVQFLARLVWIQDQPPPQLLRCFI